jgi:hypothetical protein
MFYMGKIESGRSWAVVLTGVVPVECPPGAERGMLMASVNMSAALLPLCRAITVEVSDESPEALAKRLQVNPNIGLVK